MIVPISNDAKRPRAMEPMASIPYLLNDMINIAVKNYKNRSKKTYSFDSNILSNYNGLKGAKGKLKR